jgi:hypothetical protein
MITSDESRYLVPGFNPYGRDKPVTLEEAEAEEYQSLLMLQAVKGRIKYIEKSLSSTKFVEDLPTLKAMAELWFERRVRVIEYADQLRSEQEAEAERRNGNSGVYRLDMRLDGRTNFKLHGPDKASLLKQLAALFEANPRRQLEVIGPVRQPYLAELGHERPKAIGVQVGLRWERRWSTPPGAPYHMQHLTEKFDGAVPDDIWEVSGEWNHYWEGRKFAAIAAMINEIKTRNYFVQE